MVGTSLEHGSPTFAALSFCVGVLTAAFNVVAGGGSLLVLPLLVEAGLSPQQANATNRVGVLTQAGVATALFAREGEVPWADARWDLPLVLVGALGGAQLAASMSPDVFQRGLALFFAAMGCWLIYREIVARKLPSKNTASSRTDTTWWRRMRHGSALLLLGLYAGFIQAGVGVLMLIVWHGLAGHSLLKSNALKALSVIAISIVALVVFAQDGLVLWSAGLWLSLGGAVGAWLGVRFATRVPQRVLRVILIVAVFLASARFAGLL